MPGRSTSQIHCYLAALGFALIAFGCTANEPFAARGFGSGPSFLNAGEPAAGSGAPTADQHAHPAEASGHLATAVEPVAAVATPASTLQRETIPSVVLPSATPPGETTPGETAPDKAEPTDAAPLQPQPVEADPRTNDTRQLERDLRHELVTAADPTAAALELAGLLTDLERPREALAALEAAMMRHSGSTLRIAHAGVQRDLGQRHLAVAELESLRAAQGALAIAPGVLFELAELQWLEGRAESAVATTSELRRAYGDSAWWTPHGPAVQQLEQEASTLQQPQRLRLRDLLGNLRGAPSQLVRLRTLEEIVRLTAASKQAGPEPRQQALADLRDRAIAIGCGDENATVRARAIQLAEPDRETALALGEGALADVSAVVRRCAAPRCAEWLGKAAIPLLLQAMATEQDGSAFRAMHEALAALVPVSQGTDVQTSDVPASSSPTLAPHDEEQAERRSAVAAAWRQRCQG